MVSVSKLSLGALALLAVSGSVFGEDVNQNEQNLNDVKRLRKEMKSSPMKFKSPMAGNPNSIPVMETQNEIPEETTARVQIVEGGHATKLYQNYKVSLEQERVRNVEGRVEGRVEGVGAKDGFHHYHEYDGKHGHKHGHKGYKDHGIYTDSSKDPYDRNRAGSQEYVDPSYYGNVDSINHDPYYMNPDSSLSAGKAPQPVSAAESIFWNGYYDVADRGVLNTISDFFAPSSGGKGRAPYWETGGIGNRRN